MSAVMQIFLNEFGINKIHMSTYHPQTNGACKCFYGTLKSMLRSLTGKFPDLWDTALPWVLFTYREVPVETLGCSPFDLLFGQSVAGLFVAPQVGMVIIDRPSRRQAECRRVYPWHPGTASPCSFVANEQATQERPRAQRWACQRAFQPGDKALVLLPIPGNPLQAKFHSPYIIEQQLGPVDSVVSTVAA